MNAGECIEAEKCIVPIVWVILILGALCFVTGCPCNVWGRVLAACMLVHFWICNLNKLVSKFETIIDMFSFFCKHLLTVIIWIYIFITHAPLFRGGAAYVYESPLGDWCLIMNIHNPFMHCAMSQYVFKPRDVIMLNNRISVATITYARASPCRVPLNGMFHQDSATWWNKS